MKQPCIQQNELLTKQGWNETSRKWLTQSLGSGSPGGPVWWELRPWKEEASCRNRSHQVLQQLPELPPERKQGGLGDILVFLLFSPHFRQCLPLAKPIQKQKTREPGKCSISIQRVGGWGRVEKGSEKSQVID